MPDLDSYLSSIKSLIDKIRIIKNEVAVIVVANVKSSEAYKDDYERHSLKTEFFAEYEIEQIITAFRENEFYVIVHRNENDFFKWYYDDGLNKINKKFKVVYNAAAGGNGPGKKALIPSFCNLVNLPLTSSNAYVVSLCRHKYHLSSILKNHGLPTIQSWYFNRDFNWLLSQRPKEGTKIIAKPTYESASIGVDETSVLICDSKIDKNLIEMSTVFNQPITVQEFIPGYEVEVPLISEGGWSRAIKPIGLSLDNNKFLDSRILTYNIVYQDEYGFYDFKEFGEDLNRNIIETAEKVATTAGIEGFGRVDFRIKKDGSYYIMDVSTYPHIIKHSSFWYLLKGLGFEYRDIFALLLGLTGKRYNWWS